MYSKMQKPGSVSLASESVDPMTIMLPPNIRRAADVANVRYFFKACITGSY